MSEKKNEVKQQALSVGPFGVRITAPAKSDFDKYYYDISEKEVFKSTGQVDDEGIQLGVSEKKFIVKKLDIQEFVNSQADQVGVDAYLRSLASQGESIEDYHTEVDADKVVDFSQLPNSLAEVMTSGDKAKEAFKNMDPALRGSHTTIEGFLNSLTQDKIDAYIKGKVEAAMPKKIEEGGDK